MPSMRLVYALTIAAACCADAATTHAGIPGTEQARLPLQLLVPGNLSPDELPPNVDGPWYAVTVNGSSAALKRVQIHLRSIKDPGATGDLSLSAVEWDIPDSVLFFVRGRIFQPSEVSTWYLGVGRIVPGTELPINSPGHRWSVFASKQRYDSGYLANVYTVGIRDQKLGRTQTLGTRLTGYPNFQWVGDLDSDGKMDMFVYDSSRENGSREWILYLSHGATGGDLLEKSGSFSTLPGC